MSKFNYKYEVTEESAAHADELSRYMIKVATLAINNKISYELSYYQDLSKSTVSYNLRFYIPVHNPMLKQQSLVVCGKSLEQVYNDMIVKMKNYVDSIQKPAALKPKEIKEESKSILDEEF